MEFTRHLSLLTLALLTVLALYGHLADACMCEPMHPQGHYCKADYVVLLRVVRKSKVLEPGNVVYKVQIKRTYKATPEARRMLRDGRISTPGDDAMCGVDLTLGKVYIVAGRMRQLNLCNYYKDYTKMNINERHGFSGAYSLGCNCTLNRLNHAPGDLPLTTYIQAQSKHCRGMDCLRPRDSCAWSFKSMCEVMHSSCVPYHIRTRYGNVQHCRWRRTHKYNECISNL